LAIQVSGSGLHNGIINASAKDMGTGKNVSMTITGGSALPRERSIG
jgi:hypothetical protein